MLGLAGGYAWSVIPIPHSFQSCQPVDPKLILDIAVPLAALILSRDALLGLFAFYYRYISLPAPKTLARYWDFSLPSAEVRPTGVSKVNTALQLALVGWTMGGMVWDMGVWGEEGLRGMW